MTFRRRLGMLWAIAAITMLGGVLLSPLAAQAATSSVNFGWATYWASGLERATLDSTRIDAHTAYGNQTDVYIYGLQDKATDGYCAAVWLRFYAWFTENGRQVEKPIYTANSQRTDLDECNGVKKNYVRIYNLSKYPSSVERWLGRYKISDPSIYANSYQGRWYF